MEAQVEAAVLESVEGATGAYVSSHSSGFGNTEVVIRLYLESDDLTAMTSAVDAAFAVAWAACSTRPVGIDVGVVIGDKPDGAGSLDPNEISLGEVADRLAIPAVQVHASIHLTAPDLEERYGAWVGPGE